MNSCVKSRISFKYQGAISIESHSLFFAETLSELCIHGIWTWIWAELTFVTLMNWNEYQKCLANIYSLWMRRFLENINVKSIDQQVNAIWGFMLLENSSGSIFLFIQILANNGIFLGYRLDTELTMKSDVNIKKIVLSVLSNFRNQKM